MLIHNITFLIESSRTEEFLRWMHSVGAPILRKGGSEALSLSILREVEGEVNPPDRGVSIAAQSRFPDEEVFRAWEKDTLDAALAAYRDKFGPEALAFCTLLESLDFVIAAD